MEAIGYSRVSTEEQARHGVSLSDQKARIESWCASRGFSLSQHYEDAGISGKSVGSRPGLRSAMVDVCRRKGVLVVVSLSRLARSTTDAINLADQLKRSRAQLASLTESVDTTTASGVLFFTMLAALAQFERDVLGERTKSAMRHLRKSGRRISGRIPYGYQLDEDGRTLVPDEREQLVLAMMEQLRTSGLSFRAIAAALEDKRVPTKTGAPAWSGKVIRDILRRRAS